MPDATKRPSKSRSTQTSRGSKSKGTAAKAPVSTRTSQKSTPAPKVNDRIEAPATRPDRADQSASTHRWNAKRFVPTAASAKAAASGTVRAVQTRRFWLWVGGVAVVLVAALVLWWQWQRSYVAVVGGQYLSAASMDEQLRANYATRGLSGIIQQQLVLQEATRQNLTASQAEVEEKLNDIKTNSGGEQAYQEQLTQLGIAEEFLRYQLEVQVLREKLLADKIQVSDEEIETYYNENKSFLDPDDTQGLDPLREQIRDTLRQQKLEQETPAYLEALRNRTQVSEHLDHLSLSFWDFLNQTIAPLPGNLWSFIAGRS